MRAALDAALFGLALGAILLELVLRAVAAAHPSPVLARLDDEPLKTVERARRRQGYVHLGFPCNRGGHYDGEFFRKHPGGRMVASIGDSFALGVVPHKLHFTTVCEERLGCPVFNLGIAGVAPPEYLRMLVDEALPLDPDVVVIDVFVGNDLAFNVLRRERPYAGLRGWLQRENVLLCVAPQRLLRIAAEKRRRAASGAGVASVHGAEGGAADESDLEERFPWIVDPSKEIATISDESYWGIEVARAMDVCGGNPISLQPFQDAMLSMKRAAGATKLAVMLIPDEFQVDDEVWATLLERAPEKDLERDRPQRLVVPWLESNGMPCLDLLPVLRAVPPLEDGGRHLYHLRDTHLNARGNRVVWEALAEFLRAML